MAEKKQTNKSTNPVQTKSNLNHQKVIAKLGKLQFRDYILWAAVAIILIWLISQLTSVIIPFVAAALIAYIFEPLVQKMGKIKIGRSMSAIIILIVLLLITIGLISLLFPLINNEVIPLIEKIDQLPLLIKNLLAKYIPGIDWSQYLNTEYIRETIINNKGQVFALVSNIQKSLIVSGSTIIGLITNLILFPVAFFFFVRSWPQFSQNTRSLLPPQIRSKVIESLDEIDKILDEYFHGQILVMISMAIFYSLSLSLINFPNGFSLGILIGLLVLIPYIGYSFGLALCIIISLLHGDSNLLIGVIVIFTVSQLIESYLLTPFLVGERIGLHPLLVIFALLAFGSLFGFIGVLLALPASAIILVLLRRFKSYYQQSKFYRLS